LLLKLYKIIEETKKENTELQKPFVFLVSAMNLKASLEKNNSLQ